MGIAGEKANHLTDQQRFQLWTELKSMAGEIEAGKMSAGMVLEPLKQRLGFDLTIANIKKAAETVGITLHRRIMKSGGGHYLRKLVERVEKLEADNAELRRMLEEHLTTPDGQRQRYVMKDGRAVAVSK